MTTKSIGQEGFVWFIGRVEDREDPLQLGRVKVRIMDFHPESKSLVPPINFLGHKYYYHQQILVMKK